MSLPPEQDEPALAGSWRVERVSGIVPRGLRKRIGDHGGWTLLGPLPVGYFRLRGSTLDYALWPVRDELTQMDDGTWLGRALVLGREFCRFRLVRRQG
jgi:hypothetical protein